MTNVRNELIPIRDHNGKSVVSSRELYEVLELHPSHYSRWINRNIETNKYAEENDDYSLVTIDGELTEGKTARVYALSTKFAKKLAMASNSDIGNTVREYFIRVESEWQSKQLTKEKSKVGTSNRDRQRALSIVSTTLKVGKLFGAPAHLIANEAIKEAKDQTGVDFSKVLQLSPIVNNIKPTEEYLEPNALARRFNLKSAQVVNKLLERYGYQEKTADGWKVTSQGEESSTRHMWNRGSKSGYNYKWSVEMFETLLPKEEDAA